MCPRLCCCLHRERIQEQIKVGEEIWCTHTGRTGLHIERFFWVFLGTFFNIYLFTYFYEYFATCICAPHTAVVVEASRGHWTLQNCSTDSHELPCVWQGANLLEQQLVLTDEPALITLLLGIYLSWNDFLSTVTDVM